MPAIRRRPSTYGARASKIKAKYMRRISRRGVLRRSDTSTIDTTNMNNTGIVGRGSTDLALNSGPFPPKKWVEFEYFNTLTSFVPAALLGTITCKPSDLYDFDNTAGGYYGNKQPLYYDILLSSTGPYKQYKVWSWVITYTVVNNAAGPVTVYAFPTLSGTGEMDQAVEFDNFPGVKKLFLTKSGGGKDIGNITVRGTLMDVYSYDRHSTALAGTYNSSPSVPVYGGIGLYSGDGSTQISVSVAVKAVLHTELSNIDALVS